MKKVDLIPGSEAHYNAFMHNLYGKTTTNAVAWGILPAVTSPSILLLSNWTAKYGITINPTTCTQEDVAAKDLAKDALTSFTRPYIKKNIYLNGLMVASDIISCGLVPHKTTRSSAGKPASIPAMEYVNGNGHTIWAHYHQSVAVAGSSGNGKPDGVGYLEIAWLIAATGVVVPPDPSDYGHFESGTKSPVALYFAAAQAGQTVWLAARWVSTDHSDGDWTDPVSKMIP